MYVFETLLLDLLLLLLQPPPQQSFQLGLSVEGEAQQLITVCQVVGGQVGSAKTARGLECNV
jgi:hypothetical protein